MKCADAIDAARIRRDWRVLCADIGERRAGTEAERNAAAFVGERLRAAGCSHVREETFPCKSLRGASVALSVLERGRWRPVEAVPLVGAPGTPGGRIVEADLVWVDSPEGVHRLRPGALRGRIAAWFGPLPTLVEHHRRLVAAKPAAVLQVDERLPFAWTKQDGVYPYWAKAYGMPPTFAVPYLEAWRWRRDGLGRVRLAARVELQRARSQNVIGELPGEDPRLPAVVVTAHHDTQAGNPGADDNGSGVMALLELARVLAPAPRVRTVRFISFGAEEQLSVGAAAYLRKHGAAVVRTSGLVVNFDSVSSPLGHFEMWCVGETALEKAAVRAFAREGLDVVPRREVTPFVDNFPFNRAGVPSLWFMRANFPGGRWQHHSPHDTLKHVSVAELVRLLRGVTPFMQHLASTAHWPFAAEVPADQRREARRVSRDLFGV
jgi:hypothetical protein